MIFPKLKPPPKPDTIKVVNAAYSGTVLGVQDKPALCGSCKLLYAGTGFVEDVRVPGARITLLLSAPTREDVRMRQPFGGNIGQYVYKKHLLGKVGVKIDEINIVHVLRCYPGGAGYPIGSTRKNCERSCRAFDLGDSQDAGQVPGGDVPPGRTAFFGIDPAPELALITFDPADLMKVPAYTRMLHRDMKKAAKLAEKKRIVIGLGEGAARYLAPFIEGRGGLKAWHGHYFEI